MARRKWRHPGPGAVFSIPSEVEVENGGPSASGRHLRWPHLREPEMRSSKMATGSGRAAIFHLHLNGDRKNRPILLPSRRDGAHTSNIRAISLVLLRKVLWSQRSYSWIIDAHKVEQIINIFLYNVVLFCILYWLWCWLNRDRRYAYIININWKKHVLILSKGDRLKMWM